MKRFLMRIAVLALAVVTLFSAGGLAENVKDAVESVTINAKIEYMQQQLESKLNLTSDEDGCTVIKYDGTDFSGAITSLLIQMGMDKIVIDTGDGALEITAADLGLVIDKLFADNMNNQSIDYNKVINYINTQFEADAQYLANIISSEISRLMMLCMQKGLLTYSADGSVTFSATVSQLCDVISAYLTALANDPVSMSMINELQLWEAFEIDSTQLAAMLPSLLTSFAEQVKSIPSMRVLGDIQLNILSNGSVTLKANFTSSDVSFNVSGQFDSTRVMLVADVLLDNTVVNMTCNYDDAGMNLTVDMNAGTDQYLKAVLTSNVEATDVNIVYRDGDNSWQAELNVVDGVGKGRLFTNNEYNDDYYYYYNSREYSYGNLTFDLNKCEFSVEYVHYSDYSTTDKISASLLNGVFDFEISSIGRRGDIDFIHELNIANNRVLYKGISAANYDEYKTVNISAIFDDESVYADVDISVPDSLYLDLSATYNVAAAVLTFDANVYSSVPLTISGRFDNDDFIITVREDGVEANVFGNYTYVDGVFELNGEVLVRIPSDIDTDIKAGEFTFCLDTTTGLPLYSLDVNVYNVQENPLELLSSIQSYFDGKTWKLDVVTSGETIASYTANITDLPNEKSIEILASQQYSNDIKIIAGVRDISENAGAYAGTLFIDQYDGDELVSKYEIPYTVSIPNETSVSLAAELNVTQYGQTMRIGSIVLDLINEMVAPEKHISGTPLSADELYSMLSMMMYQ